MEDNYYNTLKLKSVREPSNNNRNIKSHNINTCRHWSIYSGHLKISNNWNTEEAPSIRSLEFVRSWITHWADNYKSKAARTDNPAKYHPIGVSSLIVCVFHWTLARRLDQVCPPCSRQKGFRPGDIIAENTVLLKEILRWMTDQSCLANLNLVFLDIKKAFWAVRPLSWP